MQPKQEARNLLQVEMVPYAPTANSGLLVHIVDQDLATCETLGAACSLQGFEVSFSTNLEESRLQVELRRPDVLLLNTVVKGRDTTDFLNSILTTHSGTKVICIQDQVDLAAATGAIRRGVIEVFAKPIFIDQLLRMITQSVGKRTMRNGLGGLVQFEGLPSLTPREREVLDLLVTGLSNRNMGRRLGISSRTVEVHRARIMQKLGASNAVDLMRRLYTNED